MTGVLFASSSFRLSGRTAVVQKLFAQPCIGLAWLERLAEPAGADKELSCDSADKLGAVLAKQLSTALSNARVGAKVVLPKGLLSLDYWTAKPISQQKGRPSRQVELRRECYRNLFQSVISGARVYCKASLTGHVQAASPKYSRWRSPKSPTKSHSAKAKPSMLIAALRASANSLNPLTKAARPGQWFSGRYRSSAAKVNHRRRL